MYYFSSRQTFISNSMLFDTCTFKRNKAHMGSAVAMVPNIFFRLSTGRSVAPKFRNCQFLENLVYVYFPQSHGSQRTHGIATIYASSHDICFQGYNRFENNWGSALYIVNGITDFQRSSVSFINNTGLQGGAVALVGSSTMIVGPNSYKFEGNRAFYQGGAIYVLLVDKNDFTTSRRCFIQYLDDDDHILSREWKSKIAFVGNKAGDSTYGHAIFATSFYPCQVVINRSQVLVDGTAIRTKFTLVDISEVITSRGKHITFDSNAALQPQIATDSSLLQSSKSTPLMVIPGKKHCHGVTITDDLHHRINPSFNVAFDTLSEDVELDSTLVRKRIQLRGQPGTNATLIFQTMFPRQSYIKLEVKLVDCPPGFKLNDNSECICNKEAYVGLFKCRNYRSYLLPGYWAGLIDTPNGLKLVTSVCPFYTDYSSNEPNASKFEVILPRTYSLSELSKTVCGHTRTGIACGKCQANYTVHFHSPDFLCEPAEPAGCKLGWLFYVLSELLPVTLVFITALVINVSFTSGAVNGFILFSQLLSSLDIDASGIVIFPDTERHQIKHVTQVYQVIYGFFNLDFFSSELLSFCLWKDASALDMLAFKYITIVFTLTLILAVTYIMNQCGGRCLGKYCRITTVKSSVIHGLSTFLVICYAQCVRVSLGLLIPLYIHVEEKSNFRLPLRVWLNGEFLYFSKEHLPYALPAIFCLLTIGLLPPILLLVYPLLNKVLAILGLEDQRVVKYISQKLPVSSLKPLLDSFQGCFKDNLRFFAGLYFLYRWTVLLVYISANDFGIYYTTIGGMLLFILTLHTICQPYIKRAHNITDTLLLSNLVLIISLSSYNYHKSRSRKIHYGATVPVAIVQLVLIYLPLVVLGVYLLFVSCKQVVKHGFIKNPTVTKLFLPERANRLRDLVRTISAEDGDSDEDEDEFTHDRLMDEDVEYNSTCNYSNFESRKLEGTQSAKYH